DERLETRSRVSQWLSFFFSSRRRHTRFSRDWSSDVCSSDLNDATLERYAKMALAQAEAGAHMLGPSGMMDGQVGVIRRALDDARSEERRVGKEGRVRGGPATELTNTSPLPLEANGTRCTHII